MKKTVIAMGIAAVLALASLGGVALAKDNPGSAPKTEATVVRPAEGEELNGQTGGTAIDEDENEGAELDDDEVAAVAPGQVNLGGDDEDEDDGEHLGNSGQSGTWSGRGDDEEDDDDEDAGEHGRATPPAATPIVPPSATPPVVTPPQTTTPPVTGINAAQLYTANCATCHGGNGAGRFAGRTAAQVTTTIKNGRSGMPTFAGRLTLDQIAALANYVVTQ